LDIVPVIPVIVVSVTVFAMTAGRPQREPATIPKNQPLQFSIIIMPLLSKQKGAQLVKAYGELNSGQWLQLWHVPKGVTQRL